MLDDPSLDVASIGNEVAEDTASGIPFVDIQPANGDNPSLFPDTQDLPPELQPDAGDILLAKGVWPWSDLRARSVPESWLYMSRRVIGSISQLVVQTDAGPKLLRASTDGTLTTTPGNYQISDVAFSIFLTLVANTPVDLVPVDTKGIQVRAVILDIGTAVAASWVALQDDLAQVFFRMSSGYQHAQSMDLKDMVVGPNRKIQIVSTGAISVGGVLIARQLNKQPFVV